MASNLILGGSNLLFPRLSLRDVVDDIGNRHGHGLGDLGLTPAQRDARAAAQIMRVRNNLTDTFNAKLTEWGPAVDAIGAGVKAMSGGTPQEEAYAMADLALTGISMLGPVGAAIGTILRVVFQGLKWLISAYPARALSPGPDSSKYIARAYVARYFPGTLTTTDAAAAKLYRDEGRFWIGTMGVRAHGYLSWDFAKNNENYYWEDHVTDRMPVGGFGADRNYWINIVSGTEAERLAKIELACRPRRMLPPDSPPLGALSWYEFYHDPANAAAMEIADGEAEAAIKLGSEIHAKLVRDGDPKYIAQYSDANYGYWGFTFKWAGVPNATLINLLTWLFAKAPEEIAAGGVVAPSELVVLMAAAGDTRPAMYWEDGLTWVIKKYLDYATPYRTYFAKALVVEYTRRREAGLISLPRAGGGLDPSSQKSKKAPPGASKPWSTGEKVAAAGGAAAAVALVMKLLKMW